MIETIFSALLPAVITVLLGYFAARHHDFAPQDAPTLIRMVMTYALPVSLFAAAVGTTRAALGADLPMLIVLTIAIIGLYCVIFLVSRFVFHLSLGMSALWALAAAGPSIGFFGPSVVGELYGASGVVPVAIANLVEFATVVPVTVILLSTAALPMLVVIALLGVQYQVAETEAASVLFISMLASLITLSAFIAITSG
jgi:malonate transporter and related proteins